MFRNGPDAITDIVVAFIFAMLLYSCVAIVLADEHSHPPQDIPIHERFYADWMRPDDPEQSCCSNKDCYPAEFKNEGGTWFAKRREDGEWIVVPDTKFEHNRDNPDGRNHVCMQEPGSINVVFCAILGWGN